MSTNNNNGRFRDLATQALQKILSQVETLEDVVNSLRVDISEKLGDIHTKIAVSERDYKFLKHQVDSISGSVDKELSRAVRECKARAEDIMKASRLSIDRQRVKSNRLAMWLSFIAALMSSAALIMSSLL